MSLVDEIEDEVQQLADREAHWRARNIALVEMALEHDLVVSLYDNGSGAEALKAHLKAIMADLKAERSLPLFGTTKPAAAAYRQVVVIAEERPIDLPLPPKIEAPYSPSDKLSEASDKEQTMPAVTPKKRPVWSDEARAAAADRARKRNAAKAANKTAKNGHAPAQAPRPGILNKPYTMHEARMKAAREQYFGHVNQGGVINNDFESGLMADYGLNRTEVMSLRNEALAQRSDTATAKAGRNSAKWDTTPPL